KGDHHHQKKVEAMSSVYIASNVGKALLADEKNVNHQRRPTISQETKVEIKCVEIGHDTLIAWFNRDFALPFSSLARSSWFRVGLFVALTGMEILDVFVLLGLLPKLVDIFIGSFELIIALAFGSMFLSLDIVKTVIRTQAMLYRVFFWGLYLVFFNIVL